MLILARSLRELRFGELMQVYAGSNGEGARERRDLPWGFALQLAEQELHQYLKEVFFPTPGALCAVWEEGGHYVSALRLEPYRDGLLLAALETAPQARRQGYAAQLIRQVQQHLAEQERVKLYSHVHKKNIPSRKTHEACGFREISDCAVYLNGSVDYRCCTMVYEG